jgi:hypothetical protein
MSTRTKFTRSAALIALGAAAMIGTPALASATPFTWYSGDDGGSAADVAVDGAGNFEYTLDNASGSAAAAGVNVSTFQFLGSTAVFDASGPTPLAAGITPGGAEDGITFHLIQGGTYDADTGIPPAARAVGTGYAVTW